jgi:integrase
LAAGLVTFEQYMGVELVNNIPDDGDHFKTWLEQDEAQQLLNAPDNSMTGKRDRVVLLFLLGLGMRRAEAVSVTWEQILRKDNMWLIVDVLGKRNKVRTLRIPDRFYTILEDYGRTTGKVLRSVSKSGVLGDSLSVRAINQIIEKYARELNVDMTPHTLRRTAATLSYGNGASLREVQRMLGHASVETTQKSYIQPLEDLENFAAERMPFSIGE